jgi:hypothetical protein
LPPLHIRLGAMNNSLKAMNQNVEDFRFLVQKFPWVNEAKTTERLSVDLQVEKAVNDANSDEVLKGNVKRAWEAIRLVADDFLDRHKALNYI